MCRLTQYIKLRVFPFSLVLNTIRNMTAPVEINQTVLHQTANSLTALVSSLREAAELLSDAGGRVDRTLGLNLNSRTMLQLLEVK